MGSSGGGDGTGAWLVPKWHCYTAMITTHAHTLCVSSKVNLAMNFD